MKITERKKKRKTKRKRKIKKPGFSSGWPFYLILLVNI
jgi:hypothetical protein